MPLPGPRRRRRRPPAGGSPPGSGADRDAGSCDSDADSVASAGTRPSSSTSVSARRPALRDGSRSTRGFLPGRPTCPASALGASDSASPALRLRAPLSLPAAVRASVRHPAAGIGVAISRGQSNLRPGFWASIARRTSSVNGSRPTLTCGGVRNQNSTRGRDDLPRRPALGSTSEKCSYPRLSRENFRKGTVRYFVSAPSVFELALASCGLAASGWLRLWTFLAGFAAFRCFAALRAWRARRGGPLDAGRSRSRRRRLAAAMHEREADLIADACDSSRFR